MNLKVRQFREASGMTQKELSVAIGKSVGTIQAWEGDRTFPPADDLCALCDLFGTDPNTMVGWYEDHPEDMPSAASPPGLTADESRVVESYRELTPERRRVIAEQVEDAAARSRAQEVGGASCDSAVNA